MIGNSKSELWKYFLMQELLRLLHPLARIRGVYSGKSDSLVLLKNFEIKSGDHTMKEQNKPNIEARFWDSMPKNPYNNVLFYHIDGFDFS